jgi:hypothetical protein
MRAINKTVDTTALFEPAWFGGLLEAELLVEVGVVVDEEAALGPEPEGTVPLGLGNGVAGVGIGLGATVEDESVPGVELQIAFWTPGQH